MARLDPGPGLATLWRTPDAFGFYRPLTQSSYLLDGGAFGYECGVGYRIVNLVLHTLVVLIAWAVATAVLVSARGGVLAALLFSTSPKAATIAVFWISARAELLMT